MPSAEIITIGTELLLGEIVDTNSRYLALCLRDLGIDLYRKTTVGDNVKRISQAIQQSRERCDIIITTGGLGPTVDDPTREAVALAFDRNIEFQPELWEQIQVRFQRFGRSPTENNRRQAYIPQGAKAIANPVGTAPIFILEDAGRVIISLPGVPREMEYLMEHSVIPYLRQKFDLHGIIKTRVLHTVGVGESQIDDLIGDLERYPNPTVGLLAHSGQVDVRITAKADSLDEALKLIEPIENELRNRLDDSVYGADDETLEKAALQAIQNHRWSITIVESGLEGKLIRRMAAHQGPFLGGQVIAGTPASGELSQLSDDYRRRQGAEVGLGVAIGSENGQQIVYISLVTPMESKIFTRLYGGTPDYAQLWAINQSLDIIRRI
jgi:competence/damage-inducible protein CinA-like protein